MITFIIIMTSLSTLTCLILLLSNLIQSRKKHQAQLNQQNSQQQSTDHLSIIQKHLFESLRESREQTNNLLKQHSEHFSQTIQGLNKNYNQNMENMRQTVDKQLNLGFEKNQHIFQDINKRISLIDAAQQNLAKLSSEVVSLQQLLNDKRSRGAFGEVQLTSLIENMIPPKHYALQQTLSNGKRVDCILFFPEPTGSIAIDSKFPLENYQLGTNETLSDQERKQALTSFKQDIRRHITDISEKYIIEGETAPGALMFIPAEAIFAHIHANHPDLVALAHQKHVWMVSPTTLMAILTTARAVIKDDATRKQVHQIQSHLQLLSKDFERFEKRISQLVRHIHQSAQDIDQAHISSKKIMDRFKKIENVELNNKNSDLIEGAS